MDDQGSVPHQFREAASIMFNPRQRNFLAVGYYDKLVRIYRLTSQLSNMTQEDEKVLSKFLQEKKLEDKD